MKKQEKKVLEITLVEPDPVSEAAALESTSGPARLGRFPALWSKTHSALEKEFEKQETLCKETIQIVRKTTELMTSSRETAAENLLSAVSELERMGLITIKRA